MLKFIKKFFENGSEIGKINIKDEEMFADLKLLIIDEADHLKHTTLEQIRNIYDKFNFATTTNSFSSGSD